jgi:hypothetical protein
MVKLALSVNSNSKIEIPGGESVLFLPKGAGLTVSAHKYLLGIFLFL